MAQAKSPRLWVFVFAVYWVSFVTYYLLWKAYNHVSDLRAAALMSTEVKPEQFAVLVRDIPAPPEGQSRKEQVDSYFKAIYPDTFYRSMVVTDNKKLMKWDNYNFESAMGPASMELLTPYLGVLGRWKLRRSFVHRNGETMK